MTMNRGSCLQLEYNYRDILLQPKYSALNSRSEADTSVTFGGHKFNLPIVPANMKTVIDEDLAVWLAERGYFYVMHRFEVDVAKFCSNMISKNLFTSISVGVNEDSYESLKHLLDVGIVPDYITVDIAHGACKKMEKMVEFIRKIMPESFLIIGNVCTRSTTRCLCELKPDAVKVGIGPGCFVSGSQVKTKNGSVKIEDVKQGDEVLTHNGKYKKVLSTMMRKEEDRIFNINNIKCTPQHEFYVVHKKHKDLINNENIHEYAIWIEAEKLSKEYLLIRYK